MVVFFSRTLPLDDKISYLFVVVHGNSLTCSESVENLGKLYVEQMCFLCRFHV